MLAERVRAIFELMDQRLMETCDYFALSFATFRLISPPQMYANQFPYRELQYFVNFNNNFSSLKRKWSNFQKRLLACLS